MRRAGIAAITLLIAAAPAAADDWFEGEWCDPRAETRLLIDPHGVGFNEHTICEWTEGRPQGDAFETALSCANVYLHGEEVVRMDEQSVAIAARRGPPDAIAASFADGEAIAFARCGE